MSRRPRHDVSVLRPLTRPKARRTLVCLSFCGGGTGPYREWAAVLDAGTDLALVCYPGREGRYSEPYARTWDEMATDAATVVRTAAGDKPYVLFGHSMGGWMAFEVAARLEEEGGPRPAALAASACNAPHRGLTERDTFPSMSDSEDELIAWMRTGGLLPGYITTDADLLEMAVDLMRADIAVRDTYRYTPGAFTTAPTQVMHGVDDTVIDPAVAEEWAAVCRDDLTVTTLPGGHFYTPEVWRRLPTYIKALTPDLSVRH
ncbi:surfactin synthase thioesterase subunit [Nonomuraea thailandensis]|uniref:Surfactin synthase thioesterase subunit n=1 Tax=Nonomuraea thailandensis TaxID=1188745 RepID=A0A9X2G6J7_9ACTN|nr:alpha/beta fold hydrolase [Nonomuraea thailandensis]MCP2353462.1 surfactin synthase thioesterase subunit [Nonomuraea thailandensis]